MANQNEYGLYVPSNFIFDVSKLQQLEVTSPEFKELLVRLYQNINAMCIALNLKDSAYYNTLEFVNGQMWFPNPNLDSSTSTTPTFRQVYRKVVDFGFLPDTGTATVPHRIPIKSGYTFTRIYGAASDTTGKLYVPIPYASASGIDDIQLDVDATNVIITTASNRTNYNVCYVVLEYIKN